MLIKRIRVEEGFFNTLNLEFSPGLNVLIGGRGVGKTSVIELLRFGLGAGTLFQNNSKESTSHALSILQSSGRVVIDINENGVDMTISRSASDNYPLSNGQFSPPIIFSQNEIETISLNAEGKVNLVDTFIHNIADKKNQLRSLCVEVNAISTTITSFKKEYAEIIEKTESLPSLKQRENELVEQQQTFQKQNIAIKGSREKIDKLQRELSIISVDSQRLSSIKQYFEAHVSQLNSILDSVQLPLLDSSILVPLNDLILQSILRDDEYIRSAVANNQQTLHSVNVEMKTLNSIRTTLEEQSRESRSKVESFTEDAGIILGELWRVRESIAQIENWALLGSEKLSRINEQYQLCLNRLERISALRQEIFQFRNAVALKLNENLSPSIHTSVTHLSDLRNYAENLENSFRGSGLKYKELIQSIAEKISPQWLLYYTSNLKYEEFSKVLAIPIDRATRILGYLNDIDLGAVLTSEIEDSVQFALLDHGSYKFVEDLSIGQRCTVSLSVILENPNRVLVVDQPENHLDNEFIVTTLVKSIIERAKKVQTIVSSHKANIPVLGGASRVVGLDVRGLLKVY